ncbi:uncharacterized protein PSFLO_03380 [Pseudozyma flocculosa]|uniref:Uncharacterized protein n=1 Tax=Pseudozyma flocculosa TaxID=84751 RepID=A0A5C3F061_9BASI|nr:uncharacterized protein PSFLO_03380 [Pseudozyma flocculosa]
MLVSSAAAACCCDTCLFSVGCAHLQSRQEHQWMLYLSSSESVAALRSSQNRVPKGPNRQNGIDSFDTHRHQSFAITLRGKANSRCYRRKAFFRYTARGLGVYVLPASFEKFEEVGRQQAKASKLILELLPLLIKVFARQRGQYWAAFNQLHMATAPAHIKASLAEVEKTAKELEGTARRARKLQRMGWLIASRYPPAA